MRSAAGPVTTVALGLFAALLAAVLGAKLLYDVTAKSRDESAQQPWAQSTMEFVTWNDGRWTAWVHGKTFVLVPRHEGKWHQHANTTLAFIDWNGEPWQAKVDGDEFLLARRGNWQGSVERATAIRYRDWSGRRHVRTVAQLRR